MNCTLCMCARVRETDPHNDSCNSVCFGVSAQIFMYAHDMHGLYFGFEASVWEKNELLILGYKSLHNYQQCLSLPWERRYVRRSAYIFIFGCAKFIATQRGKMLHRKKSLRISFFFLFEFDRFFLFHIVTTITTLQLQRKTNDFESVLKCI